MPGPDEKGKFSTQISDDVIAEALKSVKKHTGDASPAAPAGAAPSEATSEPAQAAEAAAASAPAESSSDAQKEIDQLKLQLEFSQAKGRELMDKVKDSHERMLRAVADLENFKKRAQKEKEEVQKFGSERLLKDFLPVIDNFDRALDHAKTSTDFESLKQGILMTKKLFEDTLSKHGVKSFSAVGQMFDPRLHEAMQQTETKDVPPNTVVMEVVRGYLLNERLIRPALVSVAKAPSEAAEPAATVGEPAGGEGGPPKGE